MAELKAEGMSHKDAFTKAGELWSAATDKDKKPFEDDLNAKIKLRETQIAELKKKGWFTMPDGSKSTDHKQYQKDLTGDHPKPKRANSAWTFFIGDSNKKFRDAGVPHTEVFTKTSEAWNAMSEEEKAPFMKKSEEDKIREQTQIE